MSVHLSATKMLIEWVVIPRGVGWEDVPPDQVVWLDVALVEASLVLNKTFYVGPGGSGAGQASRYRTVGDRFSRRLPVWMPHLTTSEDGEVDFTDGRHRFAWVRDHGARAFPATTSIEYAARLIARFGLPLRECRVNQENT